MLTAMVRRLDLQVVDGAWGHQGKTIQRAVEWTALLNVFGVRLAEWWVVRHIQAEDLGTLDGATRGDAAGLSGHGSISTELALQRVVGAFLVGWGKKAGPL